MVNTYILLFGVLCDYGMLRRLVGHLTDEFTIGSHDGKTGRVLLYADATIVTCFWLWNEKVGKGDLVHV